MINIDSDVAKRIVQRCQAYFDIYSFMQTNKENPYLMHEMECSTDNLKSNMKREIEIQLGITFSKIVLEKNDKCYFIHCHLGINLDLCFSTEKNKLKFEYIKQEGKK